MDDLDRVFRRLVQQIRTTYTQYLARPFATEELYTVIVPYRHNRQELGIDTNQDYEMAVMRLLSGERGYLEVNRDMRETILLELESSNPDTSLFRAFSDREVAIAQGAEDLIDEVPAMRVSDDARVAPPPLAANTPPSARSAPRPAPAPNVAQAAATHASPRPRASGLGVPPSTTPLPPLGMPLPPAPPGGSRAMAAAAEPYAAAPPPPAHRAAPPPVARFAPSAAPATSGAAGAPTGLAGHGSTVPAAGAMGARGAVTSSPDPLMATSRRSTTAATLGGRCRYCSGNLPEGRQLTFCPHCGQDLTVQQCPACSTELELGWKFCTTCGRSVASS